jgi:hypothetical protein
VQIGTVMYVDEKLELPMMFLLALFYRYPTSMSNRSICVRSSYALWSITQ